MALIQSWLDSAYHWFEKIKGSSIVRRTYRVSDLGEQLTGHSVAGYEIRLYCQQKHYVREYLWWIFPKQTYSTFRVFGSVTADAPPSLKKACELDIDLPRLRPRFLSDAAQVEAAIQAYLDILIARIRNESDPFNQPV